MAQTDTARIAELEGLLAASEARVAALEAQNAILLERLTKLEAKLGLNSSNSSLPPSTDRGQNPNRKAGGPGAKGKRPHGAQKGHRGNHRALLDASEVDHVHDHRPSECDLCGKKQRCVDDANATRFQQLVLPPVQPEVHEHRLHAMTCTCGHTTRAKLPRGIPRGILGVRLLAIASTLAGVFRLSKRSTQRALSMLFGVDVSVGAISEAEARVSAALEEPFNEAVRYIATQPVANADETSWREHRVGVWLWTLVTPLVCIFRIQAGRGTLEARKLLGRFRGVLGTDRLKSYGFWAMGKRQVCWAHLIRTFAWLEDQKEGTFAQIAGTALLEQTGAMFALWNRVREGALDRHEFRRHMKPIEARIHALLADAAQSPCDTLRSKTKDIVAHSRALFMFVRRDDVEPTNNVAERAIRHAVVMRKTSFGTYAQRGSRFIERMLTVNETLRLQKRCVLDFLVDAVYAHVTQTEFPSLLPR